MNLFYKKWVVLNSFTENQDGSRELTTPGKIAVFGPAIAACGYAVAASVGMTIDESREPKTNPNPKKK
mgnify:CR=1 FL=1